MAYIDACLNCIIEHLGGNNYKILHMNKAKMEWDGKLLTVLNITIGAVLLTETTDSMDSTEDNEFIDVENDFEDSTS